MSNQLRFPMFILFRRDFAGASKTAGSVLVPAFDSQFEEMFVLSASGDALSAVRKFNAGCSIQAGRY